MNIYTRLCIIILLLFNIFMLIFAVGFLYEIEESIKEIKEEINEIKKIEENVEKDIVIEEKKDYSKLDTVSKIRYRAEEAGLDPLLVEAISRVETGHFTSVAFTKYNNFGGLTNASGVMEFPSEEEGLKQFIRTLEYYKEINLITIEEIAGRYCPVNEENWIRMVKSIYKDLKEEE